MSFTEQVTKRIRQIPEGKVATYGQIAALVGSPKAAQTVGWILSRGAEELPWQRVIGSNGRLSIIRG